MTGYESKKAMAQDKLKQWDTPSEAFNEWWNGEYDDSTNPFTKHSLAYWAFAGWQAALAQPAQEQDATMQSLKDLWRSVCDGVGKAAFAQPAQEPVALVIDGVLVKSALPEKYTGHLYTTPPQRPWQEPTESEWFDWWRVSKIADATEAEIDFADFLVIAQAVTAKLKEKNNG